MAQSTEDHLQSLRNSTGRRSWKPAVQWRNVSDDLTTLLSDETGVYRVYRADRGSSLSGWTRKCRKRIELAACTYELEVDTDQFGKVLSADRGRCDNGRFHSFGRPAL